MQLEIDLIRNHYKIRDKSLVFIHREPLVFVGIQARLQRDNSIFVDQQTYIEQVGKRFGFKIEECKPVDVPMLRDHESLCDETDSVLLTIDEHKLYRELVGCLMYIAIVTRLDICYSCRFLSRFLEKPTVGLWKLAKRVLRYLLSTRSRGILYKSNFQIMRAYSDASWVTPRSVTGSLICFGNSPIFFKSQTQSCSALSSCEAEYIAAAETVKNLTWIVRLVSELIPKQYHKQCGLDKPIVLLVDNASTVLVANNEVAQASSRLKHLDLRYHYLRDQVTARKVQVAWVATTEQLADIFTKAGAATFKAQRDLLLPTPLQ